jgi:putative SOS response-associated peptidase YedK
MFGRFTLQIPPELLDEIFGLIEIPVLPARYDIAPSQMVAVIRQNGDGQNRLDMLHWGLIFSWVKTILEGRQCQIRHTLEHFRQVRQSAYIIQSEIT